MGDKEVKNNNILILGILSLVIIIVIIAGLMNSSHSFSSLTKTENLTSQNLTFSDDSISFNYPADMKNSTHGNDIISGSKSWIDVGFLSNDNVSISVTKNPKGYDPSSIRTDTTASVKQNSGRVLSTTDETNSNGIVVYRSITEMSDPNTDNLIKYYHMLFKANGKTYGIDVLGYNSTNSQLHETADRVFNSIKVN